MTAHAITMVCYALVLLTGVAMELAGSGGRSRVPSLSTVVERITRTRSGRVGILTGWAWLGLHFFAR
jgi:hypothetical protein